MKLLVTLLTMLFIFKSHSEVHNWKFRESGTICSIYSTGSVPVNSNETIQYTVAFAYASKEHKLGEQLRAINLKANEYVLQFNLALHRPADEFGLLGDEIDVPIQLKVNDSLLKSYEYEYGTTYYVIGENAKRTLERLNGKENILLKVLVGNVEHLIPTMDASKGFGLKRRLLKACEDHFI